jgi:hypothetical protein
MVARLEIRTEEIELRAPPTATLDFAVEENQDSVATSRAAIIEMPTYYAKDFVYYASVNSCTIDTIDWCPRSWKDE